MTFIAFLTGFWIGAICCGILTAVRFCGWIALVSEQHQLEISFLRKRLRESRSHLTDVERQWAEFGDHIPSQAENEQERHP